MDLGRKDLMEVDHKVRVLVKPKPAGKKKKQQRKMSQQFIIHLATFVFRT